MLFPLNTLVNTSVIRSALEAFTIDQNQCLTLVCKYPKSHQVISTCKDLVIQTWQHTQSQNQSFKVALFFLRIRRILPQFHSQFPFPHLPLEIDLEVGRLLPLVPLSGPLWYCRLQYLSLNQKHLVALSLVLRTIDGSFRAFSHFPQQHFQQHSGSLKFTVMSTIPVQLAALMRGKLHQNKPLPVCLWQQTKNKQSKCILAPFSPKKNQKTPPNKKPKK